jgi:hypothetical protein
MTPLQPVKTAYILTESGRPLAVYTNPDLAEEALTICNQAQAREYLDIYFNYEIQIAHLLEVQQ